MPRSVPLPPPKKALTGEGEGLAIIIRSESTNQRERGRDLPQSSEEKVQVNVVRDVLPNLTQTLTGCT